MVRPNARLRYCLEQNKDNPEALFDLLLTLKSPAGFDVATIPDLKVHTRVGKIWTAVGTARSIAALQECKEVRSIQGSAQLHPE